MPAERGPSGTGHDTAQESAYAPEGYPACAFCGGETDEMIAASMIEGHEAVERLVAAEPGSDEFAAALAEVRHFVGGEFDA